MRKERSDPTVQAIDDFLRHIYGKYPSRNSEQVIHVRREMLKKASVMMGDIFLNPDPNRMRVFVARTNWKHASGDEYVVPRYILKEFYRWLLRDERRLWQSVIGELYYEGFSEKRRKQKDNAFHPHGRSKLRYWKSRSRNTMREIVEESLSQKWGTDFVDWYFEAQTEKERTDSVREEARIVEFEHKWKEWHNGEEMPDLDEEDIVHLRKKLGLPDTLETSQ